LSELGVDELVVVDEPPADPAAAPDWVADLAHRWHARDLPNRSTRP
jgi:hypothetical protein